MAQLPFTVLVLPEMRRAEPVRQAIEICSIHDCVLEHARCDGKLLFGQAQVAEYLLCEPFGKLAIEPANQGNAFLSRNVPGADFLCGVIGGSTDSELDVRREVVKVVDPVVDGIVFGNMFRAYARAMPRNRHARPRSNSNSADAT